MEPLFFKAENAGGSIPGSLRQPGASMEPLFFKAENGEAGFQSGLDKPASMEPLFFKAENRMNLVHGVGHLVPLQWSRFFSKRKIVGIS